MAESKGSIGFSTIYRPSVPFDLYSCPIPPSSSNDEIHLTDGKSYNYNGHFIPPPALKAILRRPKLACVANSHDVDSGRVSGLVFVSERTQGLETLHIAIRFNTNPAKVEVFNLADLYGMENCPRLEDSPCFAGQYMIYVTTKDDHNRRREPWNAVYKIDLESGKTERLTPSGVADFSPSVSPSGHKIAVASLEFKEKGWDGEIEDLKTDIVIMDIKDPLDREVVISNGGWPTWGDDKVMFFHRRIEKQSDYVKTYKWGVFQANISDGFTSDISRVTPEDIDAMTPAAIDANTVAVATIRDRLMINMPRTQVDHYRHIEIFYPEQSKNENRITEKTKQSKNEDRITGKTNPLADHYRPFIIKDNHGRQYIGYHRCNHEQLKTGDIASKLDKVESPQQDVGAFRFSGFFPTFSKDGKKLAFVDNEFKNVWLADDKGLRAIYTTEASDGKTEDSDGVFCPVWSQNPATDILYICKGPSFHAKNPVSICALIDASSATRQFKWLNNHKKDGYNNAFPSTNPEGTRLVFRSTRASKGGEIYKNLYIMDTEYGEFGPGRDKVTRLTNGPWTDTHCQWSPKGDWIVFSSNRRLDTDFQPRPEKRVDLLDAGYFAIYIVNPNQPDVVVRVVGSGNGTDNLPGHVNHPCFSPDGRSIAFSSDLACVSVDPISLPLFLHSVRSYGDIFTVDIDPHDIKQNENLKSHRITHSRYENSIPIWTRFSDPNLVDVWNRILSKIDSNAPRCPFANLDGAESWHLTGHLCIPRRVC